MVTEGAMALITNPELRKLFREKSSIIEVREILLEEALGMLLPELFGAEKLERFRNNYAETDFEPLPGKEELLDWALRVSMSLSGSDPDNWIVPMSRMKNRQQIIEQHMTKWKAALARDRQVAERHAACPESDEVHDDGY